MKEFVASVVYVACFILFWVFYFGIKRINSAHNKQLLFDQVSWCVLSGLGDQGQMKRLQEFLVNAEISLGLGREYRLSGETEWDMAKSILSAHHIYLVESYFCGRLKPIKSKYSVSPEAYFMCTLYSFLSSHQCDYDFVGHSMHQKRLSYSEYGSWGGKLFDATFLISDFSVVFHKLMYTSYLYCKSSKSINPKNELYQYPESIRKVLDSRELSISRF